MSESSNSQELLLKINYLKLKRIIELNNKLKNELNRERITSSNASLAIIDYTMNKKDYTLTEIWGYPTVGKNHFRDNIQMKQYNKTKDKFNSYKETCCIISW